jgi:hypothetical protein
MSLYPYRVDVPEPHPQAIVRMPKNAGSVKGRLTCFEVRAREDFWVHVALPTWSRWNTQVLVGEPAIEGIGPATIEVWAPARAVQVDESDLERLSELAQAKDRELRAAA